MSKKTVLVVGVTADRMPDNESLRKQLDWKPGTEVTVKHVKSQEFFLGLKQLLQKYEPSLWDKVSDADGRIERGAIEAAQEVALADRHLEQLCMPTTYVIDSTTYIAQLYQSKIVPEVAAYRGYRVYTFHYGRLTLVS